MTIVRFDFISLHNNIFHTSRQVSSSQKTRVERAFLYVASNQKLYCLFDKQVVFPTWGHKYSQVMIIHILYVRPYLYSLSHFVYKEFIGQVGKCDTIRVFSASQHQIYLCYPVNEINGLRCSWSIYDIIKYDTYRNRNNERWMTPANGNMLSRFIAIKLLRRVEGFVI